MGRLIEASVASSVGSSFCYWKLVLPLIFVSFMIGIQVNLGLEGQFQSKDLLEDYMQEPDKVYPSGQLQSRSSSSSHQNYDLARDQSFGFFDDIDETSWKRSQTIMSEVQDHKFETEEEYFKNLHQKDYKRWWANVSACSFTIFQSIPAIKD